MLDKIIRLQVQLLSVFIGSHAPRDNIYKCSNYALTK